MPSQSNKNIIELTLYGRVYCHLCHDMERDLAALLHEVGKEAEFSIELIDVDEDEVLEQRFGERVPVLSAGNRELCHYFLDTEAVRAYLTEIR